MTWSEAVRQLPLIAILRGISPEEAVPVGEALLEAGIRILEVTMNSPQPLASLSRLVEHFGDHAVIGAGTVLDIGQVDAVAATGARLIISPNVDVDVISRTKELGLISLPAFATPSEAFLALKAGADALKLFPAEVASPEGLAACLAVLPSSTQVFPVGGIEPNIMPGFRAAGAAGFGIGSGLYRAGRSAEEVARRAATYVSAWQGA